MARQASSGEPGSEPQTRVWRVILTSNKGVTVFPLEKGDILNTGDNEQRTGFLPTWYVNQIMTGA